MSRTTMRRATFAVAALTTAGLAATTVPSYAGTADSGDRTKTGPASIALPAGFQPEGIEIGPAGRAFLGSRVDGDIYKVNLKTGKGHVISQGPGTPSLGLKQDSRGRLFVAGGSGGDVRVVNSHNGKVLASYKLVTGTSFLNDVVLTKKAAWVTDSANAQLFKIPLTKNGKLPTVDKIKTVPLTGGWVQGTGNNANGITTTPNGKALLVDNSSNGTLYRVAKATGVATAVDLHGASLEAGDGMLREGRKLFVVQNRLNKIAVVKLSRQGTTGTVRKTITSPSFDVPSTVARYGKFLYLPNARFTTPATPLTSYDVNRVRAAR